jgi:hypothetical protein
MSTTATLTARISLAMSAVATLSGDKTGTENFEELITLIAGRGDCPALSGALSGDFSIAAATDFLLADPSDPFAGGGNATYTDGFDPAGDKLFALLIVNNDADESLKIERGAANGLPVFDAAGEGLNIGPDGAFFHWYDPAGTAALTSGTNDKLTLTPSANTVTGRLVAFYRA